MLRDVGDSLHLGFEMELARALEQEQRRRRRTARGRSASPVRCGNGRTGLLLRYEVCEDGAALPVPRSPSPHGDGRAAEDARSTGARRGTTRAAHASSRRRLSRMHFRVDPRPFRATVRVFSPTRPEGGAASAGQGGGPTERGRGDFPGADGGEAREAASAVDGAPSRFGRPAVGRAGVWPTGGPGRPPRDSPRRFRPVTPPPGTTAFRGARAFGRDAAPMPRGVRTHCAPEARADGDRGAGDALFERRAPTPSAGAYSPQSFPPSPGQRMLVMNHNADRTNGIIAAARARLGSEVLRGSAL
jgi:hypothetical protein